MLNESAHAALDGRLAELHHILLDPGRLADAGDLARHILADMTPKPGEDGGPGLHLLRPNWEDAWRRKKYVATGWFSAERHDEVADALYAAFTAMVRFALDSTTPHRQRQNAAGLCEKLADYLDLRGRLPEPAAPQKDEMDDHGEAPTGQHHAPWREEDLEHEQKKVRLLLKYMLRHNRVTLRQVLLAVWDRENVTDDTLKACLRKANAFLERHGVAWSIRQRDREFLIRD